MRIARGPGFPISGSCVAPEFSTIDSARCKCQGTLARRPWIRPSWRKLALVRHTDGLAVISARNDSGLDQRQTHLKPGAAGLRFHPYRAVVIADDSLHNIESQTGSFADRLRRKKRIEDPPLDLRGNPRPAIREFHK